jgi:hypothetical protein
MHEKACLLNPRHSHIFKLKFDHKFKTMSGNKSSCLLTFFDSDEDLISKELKRLLQMKDFCNLDTAMCNHENRGRLLDCFNGHRFCGILCALGDAFLLWARKRGIKITFFVWRVESEGSSSLFIDLCKYHAWDTRECIILENENCNDLVSANDILSIRKYSRHLNTLILKGCSCVTNHLVAELLKKCRHLKWLDVTDCKLVGEEFILNAVRHYRNVRIDHNADAESLRRMEEQLSSIKDLIFKNMLK